MAHIYRCFIVLFFEFIYYINTELNTKSSVDIKNALTDDNPIYVSQIFI